MMTMMMTTFLVSASEMSVNFYQTTWRNNPEDGSHQAAVSFLREIVPHPPPPSANESICFLN
jgi:hypothetical protein